MNHPNCRGPALFASVCLLLILAGCGAGEEQPFSEHRSPDGNWTLTVSVAEPRMPQGKFTIYAYLKPTAGAAVRVVETTMENDGVPFTSTNIAARWVSATTALLCLRASDLPDRGLRIETQPQPQATEVEQC